MHNSVEEYYDKCTKYYTWFWYDKESLGMHYGFWDRDTKSRKEALINQYREIINLIHPEPNELILDAGCGVGGASIWLAKKTKAKFIGIASSIKQLELANKYAKKHGVSEYVKFYRQDYFRTNFKDETFDKIFAIESFCHSYPDSLNLFNEMYRILKTGGKIFMSDGILLRHPKDNDEQKLFKEWCSGWKLNGLNTIDEIIYAFRKAEFKNIEFIDKTESIKRSSNQIYLGGMIGRPFLKVLRIFRLISLIELKNVNAIINQKSLFEKGIMGYGIFYAEK